MFAHSSDVGSRAAAYGEVTLDEEEEEEAAIILSSLTVQPVVRRPRLWRGRTHRQGKGLGRSPTPDLCVRLPRTGIRLTPAVFYYPPC